jgi:hypothetical protein
MAPFFLPKIVPWHAQIGLDLRGHSCYNGSLTIEMEGSPMSLSWPQVLPTIQASGSATHPRLNDLRDQMLALAAWFQSQDLDAPKAAVAMTTLLGIMSGVNARTPADLGLGLCNIHEALATNAIFAFERKHHDRD